MTYNDRINKGKKLTFADDHGEQIAEVVSSWFGLFLHVTIIFSSIYRTFTSNNCIIRLQIMDQLICRKDVVLYHDFKLKRCNRRNVVSLFVSECVFV
jgi:general stress protein CsbA